MIVIADTTPINYLVLIGEQELLPALFYQVILPEAVFRELLATATPQVVRQWLSNHPQWLEIRKVTMAPDTSLSHLDEGEREAIQLTRKWPIIAMRRRARTTRQPDWRHRA
jgi:predicted nucleic acid-binding protein